ncbi:hypothetical protein Tco_1089809 [Tanacetum coccineum]
MLLSYNSGSNSINIIDDYDVDCFLKEVLESGDVVKSVFIKSIDKTVEVTRSSSSKPLDIDLNIPLFDEHITHQWKKSTLTCNPTTPHAPILDLETITTSKHGVKLAKHKIFDDKEACSINDLNIEYNFDISYKRAWKAKQLALESNQGCPIASFAQLPYYSNNLKLANENTVTHIDTDNEGRFKMLFIGFGVAQACY